MTDKSVLVIGIDGACWPLIHDWIGEGILPNLESLRSEGMWGDLESCIPPVTCPAWKCYSTGKNPGKLGVFWWENLDIEARKSFIPSSRDFKSREIWDFLNSVGISTGIVGMPLTYPPKTVDGFIISGGPGAPDSGYAYPSDIEAELESEFDYTPRPVYPANVKNNKNEFAEKTLEQIRLDFEIGRYLNNKYDVDFLQICSFEINGPLQHLFYDEEPTRRAWKFIDEEIGKLADEFEYVIVHSDHGTSEMDKQFFINSWLDAEGYLTRNRSLFEFFANYGIHRNNIIELLDKIGIKQRLQNVDFLRTIAQRIPDKRGLFGETEGSAIFDKVDWEKTQAVGLAQGPVYLNKSQLTKTEYQSIRDRLRQELSESRDPETGSCPVQYVFDRDEIYHGEYLHKAPDLVALDASRYHNKGGIGKQSLFNESDWKGNNSRQGLYIASGPDISHKRQDAEIYDLLPTILSLFDVPAPDSCDGEQIFTLSSI